MERKVGEVFTYNNKTYKVMPKTEYCKGCAFAVGYLCKSNYSITGYCSKYDRHDITSVIFKEINNMENNQLVIDIPKGMEIDTQNSDLTKGIVKFRPKNITCDDIEIALNLPNNSTCMAVHRDNLPKLLAISGLMNIAKYYNKDWKPDWNKQSEVKYSIYYSYGNNRYQISASTCIKCNEIFFRLSSDAQAVIDNPNFRPILDTIYKK